MIKKLKIIICFAAALTIGVHAVSAQTSSTSKATNGRFSTEVDKFFSVTDWADMDISKWVGYLEVDDITGTADSTKSAFENLNKWQAGLGIKLDKAYLSLYYNGKFNEGTTNQGSWGIDATGSPVEPVFTWNAGTPASSTLMAGTVNLRDSASNGNAITHTNNIGLLLGIGAHGFKLMVDDQTKITSIPKIQNATAFTSGGKTFAAGTTGSYDGRSGKIKPTLSWGAAQDMTFGKFTTRPSASFYMTIEYNDWVVNMDDVDIVDHSANWLTPGLVVDSGGVTIWQGGWGKLKFGVAEEIAVKIGGDGTADPADKDSTKSVAWENRLEPYTSFSIDFTKNLKLGAKLKAPLWFGYDNAATPKGFFGFGAKGEGATPQSWEDSPNINGRDTNYHATFGTGFQYTFTNDGIFGGWVEKLNLDNVVTFNAGIIANLPAYLFSSQFDSNKDAAADVNKNENGKEDRSYTWRAGYDDGTYRIVQSLSAGVRLNITKYLTLDFSFAKYYIDDKGPEVNILVSAKY
jgi:hypothetical protein